MRRKEEGERRGVEVGRRGRGRMCNKMLTTHCSVQ